ncbi:hypothetical protein EFK50_20170 [Nocardioides marmoriginsengisoli]|uniref:DM13 domain-containing protein n=1 Tax=Nocardioides marmoriginsengisoli TaxID=661483 RepID=A0A3N0CAZ4_9ACTN|nr:DM13 domain-containing protein [Nocardioides marmoriginsengisoli]RNL60632.1 hypothetical protein EFK50_20170 [Nocardioides marmoriginsengisoli]
MKRAVLVVVVAVLAIGVWQFEPWRLFTSSEIDEAVPTAHPTGNATAVPSAAATPTTLSTGDFVDAEHDTSGTARIIELADGRRFLRLEGLASSDGPDLHVWLSDRKPGGSWFKYDDGEYLRLGELKATHGNQNYPIPEGADLAAYRSAVIWCDKFNVAFGAAPVSLA